VCVMLPDLIELADGFLCILSRVHVVPYGD